MLTGIGHKFDSMTHHTHLVQRWLTIEQDEAMLSLVSTQIANEVLELTRRPSSAARQSIHIAKKRRHVYCIADQYVLQYLEQHIVLQGMSLVRSAPAPADTRCCMV
jgi:hypothetical protein